MFKQCVTPKDTELLIQIPKEFVGKELEITATVKKGGKAAAKPLVPLTDDDWALPGRPATDEELEQLAEAMDNDKGGEDIDTVFDRVRQALAMPK